jgi:hypothetical protein
MIRSIPVLLAVLFAAGPASAAIDMPEYFGASVLVNGCSGGVVSRGPVWSSIITASHCCKGNIGNKCTVEFIDGSTTTGTLLAVNRSWDFARFAIPSKSVLATAPVPIGIPDKARYEMIGWPAHRGESRQPYYFLLSPSKVPVVQFAGEQFVPGFYPRGLRKPTNYDQTPSIERTPDRWAFNADNGGIIPGTSGGIIFGNGQTIGVLSNNNGHDVATRLYCSIPDQLAKFLKDTDANGCAAWNMGEWSAPAVKFADAPTPPKLKSNDRLPKLNRLVAENDSDFHPAMQGPIPPPPDAGHGTSQGASYDESAPPPEGWQSSANRNSNRRADRNQSDGEVYDGHGPMPRRLRGIRNRASILDKLDHDVEGHGGSSGPGERGPQGLQGPPGQDFTPPPMDPLPPPVRLHHGPSILLVGITVLLSGVAFIAVLLVILVIAKTIRDSRAAFAPK